MRWVGVVVALFLGAAILAGCSSSSEEVSASSSTASPFVNVDAANTRYADTSIEATNVTDLDQAWSLTIKGKGVRETSGFTGSPVIADDVAFFQDPASNVLAVDLGSGRTLWKARYEAATAGPNGVIVAAGLVFGATPSTAFALDRETGEEVWSTKLVRNDSEKIAMSPGYHAGKVFFSTTPAKFEGNEIGVLWALDAKSGKAAWHFDSVPRALWGHPEINYGGGLSGPPAFDGEGSMYVGTGTAGPIPGTQRYPWGSSRPGPNLYANSVVKLDEKTGEVDWHYQVTPHSLCNWAVGVPLLAESRGRKMVVAGAQSGFVVGLDRETGDLIWKRSLGIHNGHDNDGLLAMRGEYEKLKTPMTVYPGTFGGVTGALALEGGTVFVPVVDTPTVLYSQEAASLGTEEAGELVALDLATGEVKWAESFPTPLYGPVLAGNDLVFAISFEGWVYAFDAESGEEVWSEKLASKAEGGLAAAGDTLLVRAGFPVGGEVPELVAYRLSD